MKQHLSVEQITSLSPEAQQRLREWWRPAQGDLLIYVDEPEEILCAVFTDDDDSELPFYVVHDDMEDGWGPKDSCLPLLSIGQCLQLLLERAEVGVVYLYLGQGENAKVFDSSHAAYNWKPIADEPEPIDALYAAVKAVLEVGK